MLSLIKKELEKLIVSLVKSKEFLLSDWFWENFDKSIKFEDYLIQSLKECDKRKIERMIERMKKIKRLFN